MVTKEPAAVQSAGAWHTSAMRCHVAIAFLPGASVAVAVAAQSVPPQDWSMFGGNVESTSAIYLHGVTVRGARRNAIFATTTYGKALTIDADGGAVLWAYTPPSYQALVGTRQIINSTPVADPDRQFIAAASPDDYIQTHVTRTKGEHHDRKHL